MNDCRCLDDAVQRIHKWANLVSETTHRAVPGDFERLRDILRDVHRHGWDCAVLRSAILRADNYDFANSIPNPKKESPMKCVRCKDDTACYCTLCMEKAENKVAETVEAVHTLKEISRIGACAEVNLAPAYWLGLVVGTARKALENIEK